MICILYTLCSAWQPMINKSDVEEFVGSLSNHLQILITRISSQESWSSDGDSDVYSLIEELSDVLKNTKPEMLSKSSHLLLTNSAYFNLPRFLKFITFIAEQNPRVINQMLSPLNKERVQEGEVYLNTVVSRLRYMIQSVLVTEIFSPELMKRVQIAVLEYEKIDKESKTTDMPAETTSQQTSNEFEFDPDEFESDMPFATDDAVKETSQPTEFVENESTDASTVQHTEASSDDSSPVENAITADSQETQTSAEQTIKNRIKKKASYQLKKQQVLDLLKELKESDKDQ